MDAKRFQSQFNLQNDVQMLLQSVSDLQDRNARLVHKQRKRLQSYESELYKVLHSIQDFQ